METDGKGLTVRIRVAVLEHPLASVPVVVYVIDEVGFAVTIVPVTVFNPADGDHANVAAPEAVRSIDPPEQIAAVDGAIVIVGEALTVTTRVVVLEHPVLASVPLTV